MMTLSTHPSGLWSAVGLLDPHGHPSLLVLTIEPRDGFNCDLLLSKAMAAAATLGLRCIDKRVRRLSLEVRAEWQTDVLVFGLAEP